MIREWINYPSTFEPSYLGKKIVLTTYELGEAESQKIAQKVERSEPLVKNYLVKLMEFYKLIKKEGDRYALTPEGRTYIAKNIKRILEGIGTVERGSPFTLRSCRSRIL